MSNSFPDSQSEVRLLEEAYANNLPAFENVLYDGWLLRFTHGYSSNNNSVWPLYSGTMPLEPKITFCEHLYAERGLRCGFRLSALPGHKEMEEVLIERGYMLSNPNWVMVCNTTVAPDTNLTLLALDDWLETKYRINPVDDPGIIEWERQVLGQISLPSRFAIVMRDGIECAYGRSIQQGKLLNIENLWTLPTLRRQGIGIQLIQGLLQLGKESGADTAYLAVNKPNVDARRLYERLGFTNRYLYRYLLLNEERR